MEDIRIGISKRQWLLVLAAVAIVTAINGIGIWDFVHDFRISIEAKPDLVSELLRPCDPPPYLAVFSKFLIAIILLVAIALLAIFLSKKMLFQRLSSIVKHGSELLIAVFIGSIFTVVSIALSSSWVDDLWCGFSVLWSEFVYYWSTRLVFPATSMLMFGAMLISHRYCDPQGIHESKSG